MLWMLLLLHGSGRSTSGTLRSFSLNGQSNLGGESVVASKNSVCHDLSAELMHLRVLKVGASRAPGSRAYTSWRWSS